MDNLTPYNPYEYTPTQLWCLGLSAINTEVNGERHDILQHADPHTFQNSLRAWWDIHDRDSYLESIAWLKQEGHRMAFNEHWGITLVTPITEWLQQEAEIKKRDAREHHRLAIVRHYRNQLGSQGIAAWDLGRIVLLARMAFTAGYISEQEAWDTLLEQGAQATRLFNSWYPFAHSYLIGRQYAMRNLDDRTGRNNLQATHRLLTQPESPWLRYPDFENAFSTSAISTPVHH